MTPIIENFTATTMPAGQESRGSSSSSATQGQPPTCLTNAQSFPTLKPGKHELFNNVAFTRVEELLPFPWEQLRENLDQYPRRTESPYKIIGWAQEEPPVTTSLLGLASLSLSDF